MRDLIDLARKLEDLTRNAGKHAGGVVIAPTPLTDFCPLFAEHVGKGDGRNPVTQFDKDDVEAIGLVKFDFLGLRTLTIIDWAVKAINARRARRREPPLDIIALPLDDTADLRAVRAGADHRGVPVRIARHAARLLQACEARPLRGPDRAGCAVSARARWALAWSTTSSSASTAAPRSAIRTRCSNRSCKPTYGVIVYQEQVMQIAQVLAGYSLGGADLLRRAMGKKKPEEMAKERVKFEAGAAKHGVDPRTARRRSST